MIFDNSSGLLRLQVHVDGRCRQSTVGQWTFFWTSGSVRQFSFIWRLKGCDSILFFIPLLYPEGEHWICNAEPPSGRRGRACRGTDLRLHPERSRREATRSSASPLRPGLSHLAGRSGKLQMILEEAEDKGRCAIDIVELVEQKAFHCEENASACAHERNE